MAISLYCKKLPTGTPESSIYFRLPPYGERNPRLFLEATVVYASSQPVHDIDKEFYSTQALNFPSTIFLMLSLEIIAF